MTSANALIGGVPTLTYFNLKPFGGPTGRNVLRYWLLLNGVEHKHEDVEFGPSWFTGLKKELIASGDNPCGQLPILTMPDGKKLFEQVAIMRYLARKLGSYGHDADADWMVDALCDASVGWRAAIYDVFVLKDEGVKARHLEKRAELYRQFNDLAAKFGGKGAHLVGGKLTFADAVVFGNLRDDAILFGEFDLAPYPHLKEFFEAFSALPAIKEWVHENTSAVN